MTKCKLGKCKVGVYQEWQHLPYEIKLEADLKREGEDVLINVEKFDHCSRCGHRVDWERIAKDLKDYFKKLEV